MGLYQILKYYFFALCLINLIITSVMHVNKNIGINIGINTIIKFLNSLIVIASNSIMSRCPISIDNGILILIGTFILRNNPILRI